MNDILEKWSHAFKLFLVSNRFFYLALALFTLSACFVAVTSLYPMAFDEEFHLGLIKIYAGAWLPYGIEHTSNMAQFGAATADASYLFHYLMSFPYRVFAAIGLSEQSIIILLRLLNVAFIATSLIVLRKAFMQANISKAVANVALAMAMLIPVFVMLAGQINYDNLLLLIFAWCIYLVVKITQQVRSHSSLPLYETWLLALALLIGMSIKYAFLPLAFGIFVWLVGLLALSVRSHKNSVMKYLHSTLKDWSFMPAKRKGALIALSLLSLFFAAHYVTNTVSYGSPIPSCEQVFTETECSTYGPWSRNKLYIANKSPDFQPLSFPAYMTTEWIPGMTERLTFAVAGKSNDFQTKAAFPLVVGSFAVLSGIGFICMLVQLVRKKVTWLTSFTLLLTFVYVGILSVQLYGDYIDTAQPVAINGRYLLPLLPLVAAVLIQAMRSSVSKVPSDILALGTVIIIGFIILSGAGIGTYILQSEAHWYWPGFGRSAYEVLHRVFEVVIIPFGR